MKGLDLPQEREAMTARELLAAEYDRSGFDECATAVRHARVPGWITVPLALRAAAPQPEEVK